MKIVINGRMYAFVVFLTLKFDNNSSTVNEVMINTKEIAYGNRGTSETWINATNPATCLYPIFWVCCLVMNATLGLFIDKNRFS